MTRTTRVALAALLIAGVTAAAQAPTRKPEPRTEKFTPRFEAVAETKLLMEGLALPNYRGVEELLAQKPPDEQAWAFARGQALLIAETGNLLMIRPPRNAGQDAWFRRATELRTAATVLARTAANRDLEGSRAALHEVTNACNRCHQTFRVSVRVGPEK